jgi:hypothetical protein
MTKDIKNIRKLITSNTKEKINKNQKCETGNGE